MIKKQDLKTLVKITLPPLLAPIAYYLYPKPSVLFILAVIALYMVIRKENLSLKSLGIRTDNLKDSLKVYIPAYLLTLLLTYLISTANINFNKEPIPFNLVWLVFFSAAVQELYFRGYFLAHTQEVFKSKWSAVPYTSIIFALFHMVLMPFRFFGINIVIFSFLLSLLWTALYIRYPNLYLMILLHFVNNLGLYFIILS